MAMEAYCGEQRNRKIRLPLQAARVLSTLATAKFLPCISQPISDIAQRN